MNKAAQVMVFFFIMALLQIGNQVYFAEKKQAEKAGEYQALARESLELLRQKEASAELIVARIEILATEAGRIENSFYIKTLHAAYKDSIFQSLRYLYIDFFKIYGDQAWERISLINDIIAGKIEADFLLTPPETAGEELTANRRQQEVEAAGESGDIREKARGIADSSEPEREPEKKPSEKQAPTRDPLLEIRLKRAVERTAEINTILKGMRADLSLDEIPLTRQLLDERAQLERFIVAEIKRMQADKTALPDFLENFSESTPYQKKSALDDYSGTAVQPRENQAVSREIQPRDLASYIGSSIRITLKNGRVMKVVLQQAGSESIRVAERRPEGEMNYTLPLTRIRLIEREHD